MTTHTDLNPGTCLCCKIHTTSTSNHYTNVPTRQAIVWGGSTPSNPCGGNPHRQTTTNTRTQHAFVWENPHHRHANHHQRTPSTCVGVGKSKQSAHQTTTNAPHRVRLCRKIGTISTPNHHQHTYRLAFVLKNPHRQHVKPPPTHLSNTCNMCLCWKIHTTSTTNQHQCTPSTSVCV